MSVNVEQNVESLHIQRLITKSAGGSVVDSEKKINKNGEGSEKYHVEDSEKQAYLANKEKGDLTEDLLSLASDYFKYSNTVELSRISWANSSDKQQYLRGCLWSPDGTCILTAVNGDGMHIIELPSELYQKNKISTERPLDVLQSAIHIKEGGTVYDYCWYPNMTSTIAETCCWIASRQHEPIHMWDAFNGELRCSYKGYDVVDEVECAVAVAFSANGDKVLGGYKKNIKIFNTEVPGRIYTEIPTKYPVSCFGIHEVHGDIVATGSWNCSINLYDTRNVKLGSIATFHEHTGGVTYLKFGKNSETLFSGARKDNRLIQWDMRNFSKPFHIFTRNIKTNQRIYFDISSNEGWLVSGDTSGVVHAWNLLDNYTNYQFNLHRDCCNGVGFHQVYPILATTSGQFHFINSNEDVEEIVKIYENSLILWWIGDLETRN